MSLLYELAVRGRLPDRLTRLAVSRRALARPNRAEKRTDDDPAGRLGDLLDRSTETTLWRPGEPPRWPPGDELARRVLGRRGLEAAAHWPIWAEDLAAAEDEMLRLIVERAAIDPGHRTLVVAGRRNAVASYLIEESDVEPTVWTPRLDDSDHLRDDAARRGLGGLEIRHGDLADSVEEDSFDRIVAIESLPPVGASSLRALGARLRPGGRLFVQLACHRRSAYPLSPAEARWLGLEARILLPATDLLPRWAPDLALRHHWELSGEHYERTARAWRRRLERQRSDLVSIAAPVVGEAAARRGVEAWRLALLARETLFGARSGQEWWISQYALERPPG